MVLGMKSEQFKKALQESSVEVEKFSKSLYAQQRSFTKFGKSMESVGKEMSLKITAPLLLMAGLSVKAFGDEEQALSKLAAAIRSQGGDVASILPSYKAFAKEIQNTSTVADQTVVRMLQLANSYGVSGDAAKGVVKEALGMSKALGIDEELAVKLTSALSKGSIGMLGRYIPALKAVKDPAEKVAKAHEELAKMFSTVQAEADTSLGRLTQLKNITEDLSEEFGKIIAEGLSPFINKLKSLVGWMQSLTEGQKKTIVISGAVAIGISTLVLVVGKLSLAFVAAQKAVLSLTASMLANPYTAIAVGIAAVVAGIIYFIKILRDEKKMLLEVKDEHSGFTKSLASEQTNLNTLFGVLKNNNSSLNERRAAIAKINEVYGAYLPKLLTEKMSLDEISASQDFANKKLIQSIALKSKQEELAVANQIAFDNIKKANERMIKSSGKMASVILPLFNDLIRGINEWDITAFQAGESFATSIAGESLDAVMKFAESWNLSSEDVVNNALSIVSANKILAKSTKKVADFYDLLIGSFKETDAGAGGGAINTMVVNLESLRLKLKELHGELEKLPQGATGEFEKISNEIAIVEYQIENAFKVKPLMNFGGKLGELKTGFSKLGDSVKWVNQLTGSYSLISSTAKSEVEDLNIKIQTLEKSLNEQALAGKINNDTLKEYKDALEKARQAQEDLDAAMKNNISSNFRASLEKFFTDLGEVMDKVTPAIQGFFDVWGSGIDKTAAMLRQFETEEVARRDAQVARYDEQIARIENSKMSEERKTTYIKNLQAQKDAYIKKSEADVDAKRKILMRKQAQREKAMALMSAIVNTAKGVAGAIGTPPPWVGIALAVLIAAMGGVQIANIASTPIPAMAKGGIATQPTMAMVGERSTPRNPEIIAPLEKLKNFMPKAQTETLVFIPEIKLKGEDIYVAFNKYNSRKNFMK